MVDRSSGKNLRSVEKPTNVEVKDLQIKEAPACQALLYWTRRIRDKATLHLVLSVQASNARTKIEALLVDNGNEADLLNPSFVSRMTGSGCLR